MKKYSLISKTAIIIFFIISADFSYSHGVEYKISKNEVYTVSMNYGDGEVMNYTGYKIYSPGSDTVFQSGLTDKNGKKIGHEAFLQVVENRHNSESKNLAKDILENLNEIAMKMPWQEDITILTIQNRI